MFEISGPSPLLSPPEGEHHPLLSRYRDSKEDREIPHLSTWPSQKPGSSTQNALEERTMVLLPRGNAQRKRSASGFGGSEFWGARFPVALLSARRTLRGSSHSGIPRGGGEGEQRDTSAAEGSRAGPGLEPLQASGVGVRSLGAFKSHFNSAIRWNIYMYIYIYSL